MSLTRAAANDPGNPRRTAVPVQGARRRGDRPDRPHAGIRTTCAYTTVPAARVDVLGWLTLWCAAWRAWHAMT